MTSKILLAIAKNWRRIEPLLAVPDTEANYQQRLVLLNDLIDEVGENEQHPLASLINMIGIAVAKYEKSHYPSPESRPENVLAYLMKQHQLTPDHLPGIGNQAVVSEILCGKRQLNVRQIQVLSQRFGISTDVFF